MSNQLKCPNVEVVWGNGQVYLTVKARDEQTGRINGLASTVLSPEGAVKVANTLFGENSVDRDYHYWKETARICRDNRDYWKRLAEERGRAIENLGIDRDCWRRAAEERERLFQGAREWYARVKGLQNENRNLQVENKRLKIQLDRIHEAVNTERR